VGEIFQEPELKRWSLDAQDFIIAPPQKSSLGGFREPYSRVFHSSCGDVTRVVVTTRTRPPGSFGKYPSKNLERSMAQLENLAMVIAANPMKLQNLNHLLKYPKWQMKRLVKMRLQESFSFMSVTHFFCSIEMYDGKAQSAMSYFHLWIWERHLFSLKLRSFRFGPSSFFNFCWFRPRFICSVRFSLLNHTLWHFMNWNAVLNCFWNEPGIVRIHQMW